VLQFIGQNAAPLAVTVSRLEPLALGRWSHDIDACPTVAFSSVPLIPPREGYPLPRGEFADDLRGFGKSFGDDRELDRRGGDFHEGCLAAN
jgi:hypothetical protein